MRHWPRFALAGNADACAFVNARRDRDVDLLPFINPAITAAFAAGAFDHLATAVAGRTGSFDDKEALLRAHLPMACA